MTIDDVAKSVNISKSTVSQYLNKRYEYMSPETKQKIERAIAELNYRPNSIARSLKKKKSQIIGVILPNVLYSFSSQVYRAIEDYLSSQDYHVIFCNSDDNPKKEKIFLEMLLDKQVDGLIVFPTNKNHSIFKDLNSRKFPIVLIGREVKGITIDIVMLNNHKASYDATTLLIDRGHKRIGFVSQPLSGFSSRIDRLAGYKDAMKEGSLSIDNSYICLSSLDLIKDSFKKLLCLEQPPTALVLGNDLILREYLEFKMKEYPCEKKSPQIFVFDQNPNLNFYKENIYSITQPTFEMGKKAAEILLEKIEFMNNKNDNATLQQSFVFESKMEIRNID